MPDREHSAAQTAAGIGMMVGATYVVARAADAYIGDSPKMFWRWINAWSVVYLLVFVAPFVLAAMTTGDATLVLLGLPFMIPLGFGWLCALSDPRGKRPTDAQRQADYEARMQVLITDYDRQQSQRMLGP